MQLIELSLFNFKNFQGTHKISLKKLNLFQGDNATGKSTIIIDSILFVLYGYANQTIKQLVNKDKNNASVNLFLEHNNKSYSITREIPSKLTILENAIPIQGSIKIKENYITDLFHDITWFRKFRLFDSLVGINILEESNLTLKKTLLSFNEDKLNIIREKLLALKKEREIYNKSNINTYPHYPSEKRKTILQEGIQHLNNLITSIKNEINNNQLILRKSNYNLGGIEQENLNLKNKNKYINNLVICPTCNQKVENKYKQDVEKEIKELINKNLDQIIKIKKVITNKTKNINELTNTTNKYDHYLLKTQKYLNKLDERLKQKKYIWSDKDIEIIKRSIFELDNFYSFYLTETIKSLEPVINHILKKIGYVLKFKLNSKGQFAFNIYINTKEFEYKELSTGQKLMISIAFKMALLLERGESGLIISDEGMSSLSEKNLTLMFELIKTFPFQLLAVVHRYSCPESFLNIFTIEKEKIVNVK